MKIDSTTTNTRTHKVQLDRKQLAQIVASAVAEEIAGRGGGERMLKRRGVSYSVAFEDETEGSPHYKIGTKAVVRIIEDLMPNALRAEDGR